MALETIDELSHTQIQDIGTNTHPQIDTAITASTNHIADGTIHFEMLDEDDMSSNSDTKAATQQSIKAYVDAGDAISVKDTSTKTSNYLVLDTDYQIVVDASSNTVTVTLPLSPATGQCFTIACLDSTFQVDIDFNGKDFYNSSDNEILFDGENVVLRYGGVFWVSS